MIQRILAFAIILVITHTQKCLNKSGNPVTWWVKLLIPGKVKEGYAYFDSTFKAPSFVVQHQQADSSNTPLTRTLSQINLQKLQTLAWNDQKPDDTTSGSKAHSKGVLAFSNSYNLGFFIDHSIPKFPSFNNEKINTTIDQRQSIYGQHILCISIEEKTLYSLISKILPIRPNIYATNFIDPNFLTKLFESQQNQKPDYQSVFTYKNVTLGNTKMKFIFKNGNPKLNSSMFQDGLNNMLKSSLLAETWGRPLQDPWCAKKFAVGNIKRIKLSKDVSWSETQDHSKWAYATENQFSCFGDMNRMDSQWKRGGAFYCIGSSLLNKALKAITLTSTQC